MQGFEQPEVAKRIRAAMKYGGIQRLRAAEILGISPNHLDRYTSGRTKYKPPVERLWQLAREAGLSPDWFGADLSRLHEIVPAGLPTFAQRSPQQIAADAARQRLDTPPSSPQDQADTDESDQAA